MAVVESSINGAVYCHPDKGEDCYQLEQTGAGTTAHQVIQMLHELPPSALLYVHLGEFDWDEATELAIAKPLPNSQDKDRRTNDDKYWLTSREEAGRWNST